MNLPLLFGGGYAPITFCSQFIIIAIDFDANRKLLPFIILIVSVMNGADAVYKIQHLPHGKKRLGGVFLSIGLCIGFLAIAAYMWIVFYW